MKLILHAAKYQTRSVTGLLLASNASENGALLIDDVLPLFHTPPLSPSIELALTHAELFVPSGVTLAGVYFAPELFEPRVNPGGAAALPTPQANTATKIAEKIKENGKGQAGTRILLVRTKKRTHKDDDGGDHNGEFVESGETHLPLLTSPPVLIYPLLCFSFSLSFSFVSVGFCSSRCFGCSELGVDSHRPRCLRVGQWPLDYHRRTRTSGGGSRSGGTDRFRRRTTQGNH